MNSRFEPRHGINHVVLVGVGGTGSALARTIARILYDMNRRGMFTPRFTLIDPDTVEEKNVGRQAAFAPGDIGQNKAMLLSRRFNLALGLASTAIPEPFDPEHHPNGHGALMIGCVDNHLARRTLSQAEGVWLDCGNHATDPSGQVVCGNSSDRAEVLNSIERMDERGGVTYHLPNAALLFPALLELEQEPLLDPEASCAELVEAGTQHLLVNDAIATAAAGYVHRLLHRIPLIHFLSFISLEAVRPVRVSRVEMETYIR